MELLNIYKQNKQRGAFQDRQQGMTFIEILVVVAIIGVIMSFGMSNNVGLFMGDTFRSEKNIIVSLLEKARSRAMSNMFDSDHGDGVCYNAGNYVLFRGRTTCLPLNSSTDENTPANTNIASVSNFSTTFPIVVFNRLTGNVTGAPIDIIIKDDTKTDIININNEGTINW